MNSARSTLTISPSKSDKTDSVILKRSHGLLSNFTPFRGKCNVTWHIRREVRSVYSHCEYSSCCRLVLRRFCERYIYLYFLKNHIFTFKVNYIYSRKKLIKFKEKKKTAYIEVEKVVWGVCGKGFC